MSSKWNTSNDVFNLNPYHQVNKNMLFDLPELESGAELERLSSILATEEMTGSNQDKTIDDHITQIILRRKGEDRLNYNQRLDRFIDYIQFLNDSSYLSAEITRLQALKKSRSNLAKRLMAMVLYRLETSQVKKIETPKHKITVVGKGGKQPIEIDYDEVEDIELFPPEFIKVKTVRTVDKDAISAHLKANKP